MLSTAIHLFLLREIPFSRFNFPRWQSWLAITFIGILIGLDPSFRAATPDMPTPPLWLAIAVGVIIIWAAFPIIVGLLGWWMKRGGRWDGQGSLFNLVAASWLVADAIGAGLTALGTPALFTMPIWMYSVWVGANALSSAIPKASLGYSIGGIVIASIPAIIGTGVVIAIIGVAFAATGAIPAPAGAA